MPNSEHKGRVSFALRSGLACAKALRNGRESVLLEYEKLCKPLVQELEGKMVKAEMLSSAQGRKKIFDKITTTPLPSPMLAEVA